MSQNTKYSLLRRVLISYEYTFSSHLKLEHDDPHDQQTRPENGRAVETDPEQLVVGAVDLRHVLQRLENPLRRAVFIDMAPPPETDLSFFFSCQKKNTFVCWRRRYNSSTV